MSDDAPGDSDAPDQARPEGDCAVVAENAERLNEEIKAVLDLDRHDILLLKMLPEIVDKLRDMNQPEESVRVKFAANRGLIAIGERVARIMRRDLAVDKG